MLARASHRPSSARGQLHWRGWFWSVANVRPRRNAIARTVAPYLAGRVGRGALITAGLVLAAAGVLHRLATRVMPADSMTDPHLVTEEFAQALEDDFVFPEIGRRYADVLRDNIAAGRYSDLRSPSALARLVTKDIQAVYPDGHLGLHPPRAESRTSSSTPASQSGVERTGWLADGIAYIRFSHFPGNEVSVAETRQFLASYSSAHTLVIDLRVHGGGFLEEMDEEDVRFVSAAQRVPLYNQRAGEDLWHTFLPDSRTMYVSFRGYPPRGAFGDFFATVLREADWAGADRLVIDMRHNAGGDFTKVRELLLPRLKEHRLNARDRLFVVIGRRTLSAAMTNAADFLTETNATLVGEPTGARPNGWQEKGEFRLRNSGLAVSVSTQYYRFLEGDPAAVIPHEHIPLTWEDYRSGRDPVLEWITRRR
jgi:hypothetical protein